MERDPSVERVRLWASFPAREEKGCSRSTRLLGKKREAPGVYREGTSNHCCSRGGKNVLTRSTEKGVYLVREKKTAWASPMEREKKSTLLRKGGEGGYDTSQSGRPCLSWGEKKKGHTMPFRGTGGSTWKKNQKNAAIRGETTTIMLPKKKKWSGIQGKGGDRCRGGSHASLPGQEESKRPVRGEGVA